MPFTKIVPADLQGKGVIGQPAVPGLSVNEMQESVEQVVREVAIPAVNRLIDELEVTSAAGNIGMELPSGMAPETPENVQGVVQSHVENVENPHGVTAAQVGAYTRDETDQAIDEKVQAIGAADMSKAEFATNGRYGVVDIAQASETAGEADDGVKVYTHAKSGTVHEFTGNGPNGRALMTADVQAGDTFTVNGTPVTAYMGAEDATGSMAGSAWNGKWVSFIVEDGALNFKGGGGLSAADKALLIPENLRKDVVLFAGTPREVVGSLTWQDLLPDNIDIVGEGIIQSNTYEGSAKTGDTAVSFKCLPAFDVTKYSAVMFSNCTCTGMHSAGSFKSGYCFIEDQTGKRLASAPQNGAIDLKSVSGFIYFGFGGTVSNAWGANTPYKLTIGGLTLTEI